jgi:protease-4
MMFAAATAAVKAEEPPTPSLLDKADKAEQKEESPIQHLAELRLDERLVPARTINLPIPGRTKTLQDVLERLHTWGEDERVGAVLLDVGAVQLGLPDIQELRLAIENLRAEDKKVYAFLNGTGPGGYLLACSADEIVLPPSGFVAIPGLGSMFTYMKGYFQMQGMEFDVITAGRFKYPGFVNQRGPNKYFEEEFSAILDSWFGDYKAIIGEGRKLTPEQVSEAVDTAAFSATEAQQRGLVDRLAYYDEYVDRLLGVHKLRRTDSREDGLANVKSFQDFFELINDQLQKAEEARRAVGPKIAVLHARGPIVDVSLGPVMASQIISRDDFVEVIDQLRKTKSIKAVVMRVDSPGGSAYASDVIWKALRRLDEAKPLVVSMGTVAGSGGYYIACPARRIFAQPTTLTGSIGVLSIYQCAWSYFNRSDYDITTMQRGARSLLGAPNREMSPEDRAFIVARIDGIYGQFVDRVAQTRRMPAQKVRELAEGRIYSGRQALELGLVDELGGLAEAIEAAREMAAIPESAELKILHYPRLSSLGDLFESLSAVGVTDGAQIMAAVMAPARSMPFHEQVLMFSQPPQPLCWMGLPDLLTSGPGALTPVAPSAAQSPPLVPVFNGVQRW